MGSWRWQTIFTWHPAGWTSLPLYPTGFMPVVRQKLLKTLSSTGRTTPLPAVPPAASSCVVDDTSVMHGIQIFNNNQNVTAMGNVSLNTDYADTLGKNLSGWTFTVAPGTELTVQEGAVFDISSAASTAIRGEFHQPRNT